MKSIFVFVIDLYQALFSPGRGFFSHRAKTCNFYPSCSDYTKEAILRKGVLEGIKKGFLRIIRCHPFRQHQFDPFKPGP